MIPALCRWLRRLFDPRPAARCSPLDVDERDRIKREHAPTWPFVDNDLLGRRLLVHDSRPPHLSSDRRVDEEMGPRPLRGFSNGSGPRVVP